MQYVIGRHSAGREIAALSPLLKSNFFFFLFKRSQHLKS